MGRMQLMNMDLPQFAFESEKRNRFNPEAMIEGAL